MPTISIFYGILIKMFFDDHMPPHFYAEYGEYELVIAINPNWELCKNMQPPIAIEPLE